MKMRQPLPKLAPILLLPLLNMRRPLAASLAAIFLSAPTSLFAADPPPVTVLSFNVKNYLDMDRQIKGEQVEDAPKPEEELEAVVEIITKAKPDIVGITEIGIKEVKDLQKRLAKKGLKLEHTTVAEGYDPVRHVALFSRYPITATNHQVLDRYFVGPVELQFKRGILDVTVEPAPGYELRLLGTHLKSKRESQVADQAEMRREEAKIVRAHADEILKLSPDTNLLVFGDFNDYRPEPPIKAVQGRFGSDLYLRDIQLADSDGYRWTHYWRYADVYSRIDYNFVSKGLYPEVNRDDSYIDNSPNWFTASDHRAMILKIIPKDRRIPGE